MCTSVQGSLFLSLVYQVWWLALPIPFMLLKYVLYSNFDHCFHLLNPPSSSLNNYQKVTIQKMKFLDHMKTTFVVSFEKPPC